MSWRANLRRLIEVDGYTYQDIQECLDWVFTHECEDAEFWRQQIMGYGRLRKRDADNLHKFDKVYRKFKKHKKSQPQGTDPRWYPEGEMT